jgi:hypothetical protein
VYVLVLTRSADYLGSLIARFGALGAWGSRNINIG